MRFNGFLRSLMTVSACLFAIGARAGVEHGNGGDVVICVPEDFRFAPENWISITQLDFFEGQQLRSLTPSFGPNNSDPVEMAKVAFERLRPYDPVRADAYIQRADSFMANVRFVHAIIPDIPDQGDVLLTDNCKIVQIAKHAIPQFALDKEFIIRQDLWNSSFFDNVQKAGLIIHEIIYADAVARGQVNSISARYLTQYLASERFTDLSQEEYQDLMLDTMMDSYVDYDYPGTGLMMRYFPTRRLSYARAHEFCENLDFGLSHMAETPFAPWTHIGKGILGPGLSGSAEFWRRIGDPPTMTSFTFNRAGESNRTASFDTELPFLCEVSTADL